jgi:hypothetical protein
MLVLIPEFKWPTPQRRPFHHPADIRTVLVANFVDILTCHVGLVCRGILRF